MNNRPPNQKRLYNQKPQQKDEEILHAPFVAKIGKCLKGIC